MEAGRVYGYVHWDRAPHRGKVERWAACTKTVSGARTHKHQPMGAPLSLTLSPTAFPMHSRRNWFGDVSGNRPSPSHAHSRTTALSSAPVADASTSRDTNLLDVLANKNRIPGLLLVLLSEAIVNTHVRAERCHNERQHMAHSKRIGRTPRRVQVGNLSAN